MISMWDLNSSADLTFRENEVSGMAADSLAPFLNNLCVARGTHLLPLLRPEGNVVQPVKFAGG